MRFDKELSKDIIEWDVENWANALPFWEERLPDTLSNLKALEVGARRGGLSLYLALKGANVICSDLQKPSAGASSIHKRYSIEHLVDYLAVDVTSIDFPDDHFDVVAFKSLLGGVGRGGPNHQHRAMDEIFRVLKPGGSLIFAENLSGSRAHMWARRRFTDWGDSWRYPTIKEIKGLTAKFSASCYRAYGCLGAFGRTEGHRRVLAGFDSMLDPLLGESVKYILFGYARK